MLTEKIKSKIFLAKYSVIKSNAVPYFNELLKNQYLSRDELDQLNWCRTKELISYAYKNTKYYKDRFDKIGLHPKDITHQDEFKNVPVLTREDLQNNFNDLVSKEASLSDLRISTTGGSTGQPVKVYHQKNVVRAANGWRMLSWWSLPPGVDFASVYRDTRTNWRARISSSLLWWPTHRIDLNAASLTSNDIKLFTTNFNKRRPKLLHGYVGAIDYLASYIKEKGIQIHSPEAIWVTSSPLTEIQRKNIESCFNAPVYDQYGCCEIYWLAAQCPVKKALHTFGDIRRFEFLDDQNNPVSVGQEGKITITDLENRYFPLIRYLNGDIGRTLPGTCGCGVTLPLMDKVTGRISDIIKLPNGKTISGEYMTTIFDHEPDMLKQFQVHQKDDYSVEVKVVKNENYHGNFTDKLNAVEKIILNEVDNSVSVVITQVDTIKQKGGKIRFIISDIT